MYYCGWDAIWNSNRETKITSVEALSQIIFLFSIITIIVFNPLSASVARIYKPVN